MIVTITCNPAIDKTIYGNKTIFNIGGKGINVSKVLKNLECDSLLTGFIGKENKDEVLNELKDFNCHFIEVDGKVRTNTKKIIDNELYEENENGPFISEDKLYELLEYLDSFHNEIVVISGSVSNNVNDDYYEKLVRKLKENNNYVILDCAGKQLLNGIKALPDVIKPNKDEICELFNIKYNEDIVIEKCKQLINEGVGMVVVSLGSEGCLFINKENVYKVNALQLNYKSSLGAGDALIAGVAYSKLHNYEEEKMIKLAISCASAEVEMEGSLPPSSTNIKNKLNSVIIRRK